MQYTIIRDTREHKNAGWWFKSNGNCLGTIEEKLDSGDYSIKGYEDFLSIERKGGISEFVKNILESRFDAELQRLENIRYSFVILEFDMNDIFTYPASAHIPKKNWGRIRGPFIIRRLLELQFMYKTKFLLCGGHGKEMASSIFKRFIDTLNEKK